MKLVPNSDIQRCTFQAVIHYVVVIHLFLVRLVFAFNFLLVADSIVLIFFYNMQWFNHCHLYEVNL